MHRPTRRVVVGAVLLGVTASGGAAMALRSDDPEPVALVPRPRITFGTQSPPPTFGAPPSAVPTTVVPGPLPTAVPTTVPSAVRTAPPPPLPTAGPPVPQRLSWTASAQGIALTVTMTPGARMGAPVTWTLSAVTGNADCCRWYMGFGDGSETPSVLCYPGAPDAARVTKRHTYNRAGRHDFGVTAYTDRCDRSVTLGGSFDVLPGTATAQGPEPVVVEATAGETPAGHEYDSMALSAWASAQDFDGYLTSFTVDWGDRSAVVRRRGDRLPCRANLDGWPYGDRAVRLSYDDPAPQHLYAHAGSYTVRVTAYSAGCDGTDVQSGSASFAWDAHG